MSGGSYNYLCHSWDLDDLVAKRADLNDMAERLAKLGYAPDAAAETLALVADLNAIAVRVEVALKRLTPIWKAVEWWDSSDSSEDAVHAALTTYRASLSGSSQVRDGGGSCCQGADAPAASEGSSDPTSVPPSATSSSGSSKGAPSR